MRCRTLCGCRSVAALLHILDLTALPFSRLPRRGPPIVRSREHPLGLPDVPENHRKELAAANEIIRRT
eukprot:3956675-Pleurochrysis_carterae.AAC.1